MFSPCREKIIKRKGYVKYKYNDHQKGTCFDVNYIENITRWREDMNFMFEWQEQYLTSEHSERVDIALATRT